MTSKDKIVSGNAYPFDATDSWWHDSGNLRPPPTNWAHSAARGIIADLQDRKGIKSQFTIDVIDEDTRKELVESMAAIIREAQRQNE
jgi:hypothetical protein